jgi:hypothetical protein
LRGAFTYTLETRRPVAQWTGAHKGNAFFAYANNYLIDLKAAIILDVEATRAIRQAEVGAARAMIERTEDRLGLSPERVAADSAYGSAEMLGWLVNERAIEPHIPVFDKSARVDGTFSREDFAYETLRAKSPRLRPMSGPGANGRRSRCSSRTSSASCASTVSG